MVDVRSETNHLHRQYGARIAFLLAALVEWDFRVPGSLYVAIQYCLAHQMGADTGPLVFPTEEQENEYHRMLKKLDEFSLYGTTQL